MKLVHSLRNPDESAPAAAWGTFLLRVSVGLLIFIIHGWHKLVGAIDHRRIGSPWPLMDEVAAMGAPFPFTSALAATLIQFFSAVLLALGWHTRVNASLLAAVLAGAVIQNLQSGRDPQLAILYVSVVSAFVLIGGGRFSLDANAERERIRRLHARQLKLFSL